MSRERLLEPVAELADGKLYRLRASVYYEDQLGNRVKAMTKPSEPVQPDIPKVLAPLGSEDGRGAAGASEADRGIRSGYDVHFHGNRLIYRTGAASGKTKTGRGSR